MSLRNGEDKLDNARRSRNFDDVINPYVFNLFKMYKRQGYKASDESDIPGTIQLRRQSKKNPVVYLMTIDDPEYGLSGISFLRK